MLHNLGLTLPDEDVRAPIGAHVERLVTCVQDEYLMHGVASVPASMALGPGFVAPSCRDRLEGSLSEPWRARPPSAPPATGRPMPCRARGPSRRSARSHGPGSRSRPCPTA